MKSEKQLYQWDVNQYLAELQPTAEFVDYPMGNEVIRIETDGKRCRIPDEFLQTSGFKTCYERYADGTYKAYSFNVLSSPKPPDYVYTAEERTTFEALVEKADAAIDEIKRRADSGEFTPKKGVDYFTEEEKTEMMESVSDGAIGEFRKVVDSATTEYNDNHNLKLAKYNANASEKLTTYDVNAEQHTTDYNRNAEQKLEAYNQNHTEKVAEYNANAESKTAEFDSNAAALQTEVDRLRGECDTLAAESRKQENKIDALIKLNKGQTYDILPEEGETASRTAPSGAKYVSVDKVGGKSVVWNQLFNVHEAKTSDGLQLVSDGQTITMSGNSGSNEWMSIIPGIGEFTALNAKNHRYLYTISVVENSSTEQINFGYLNRGFVANIPANYTGKVNFVCTVTNPDAGRSIGFSRLQPNTDYNVRIVVSAYDLTLMFGAGKEPTAEQFEALFPAESYPYNPGEIISSTTGSIELLPGNIYPGTKSVKYYPCKIAKGETFTASATCGQSDVKCRFASEDGSQKDYFSLSTGVGGYSGRYKRVISAQFDIALVMFDVAAGKEASGFVVEIGEGDGTYKKYFEPSQLTTSFPELHSAGTAHDEIDLDGGEIRRNVGVVDLGTLTWRNNGTFEDGNVQFIAKIPGRAYTGNGLCDRFEKSEDNALGTYTLRTTGDQITFAAPKGTEINAFIESVSGATLYYELATPTTEPVTIPETLTEWLPVEPGGTVTFLNADDSKQLAVPNAVSWVRKLNEVE